MSNSYSVGGNRLHQQPPPQSPNVQTLAGAGAGAGVGVVGGGNQGQSSKILELLDALKHEIEIIHEEASFSKYHRKDLEGKLTAQISEMSAFQKSIYDLDRMHSAIKAAYEEDIKRLRHELESRGIPVPPPKNPNVYAGHPPPSSHQHQHQHQHHHHQQHQQPRRQSLAPDDLAAHNKRLKDANSNPIPTARNTIPPMKIMQAGHPLGGPPIRPPPATGAEYRQHPHPPAPATKPADELVIVANPKIQKANISVDLVHSFDHNSVVCCVKFSPDGKYLATGCNHLAQIFEISSGRKILGLVDESAPKQDDLYIRSVCFSPDGVYLATGAEDRVIRIWDIVNGKIKLKLSGHTQDIYSLDWTRDGKSIVSGSGDYTVKIWDPETGACLKTLQSGLVEADKVNGKDAGVTSVSIRPTDGRCVVAASLDEIVRVWDLRTGHLLERFEGHSNSVYSVAFSPDGLSIASGSLDQTIRVWDLSPQTLHILSAPLTSENIPPVVITTRHRHVFSGHKDYVLSVGYPGSHSTLGRVDAAGRPVHDPSFDVEWVISGSKDRFVVFWDAKESHEHNGGQSVPLLSMTGHKNSVISIAMGPTGGLFATGSGDMKARVWRVSRPQPPRPQQFPHALTAGPSSGNGYNPGPPIVHSGGEKSHLAPVMPLPVVRPVAILAGAGGPKSAISPNGTGSTIPAPASMPEEASAANLSRPPLQLPEEGDEKMDD